MDKRERSYFERKNRKPGQIIKVRPRRIKMKWTVGKPVNINAVVLTEDGKDPWDEKLFGILQDNW